MSRSNVLTVIELDIAVGLVLTVNGGINWFCTISTCPLKEYVIVAAVAGATATMAENFEILKDLNVVDSELATRLTKAVGFRNIAVHSYRDIGGKIVLHICRDNLGDFRTFAKAVAARLKTNRQ